LDALDGPIGKVKDFYFDDRQWTVRYLVVDTGNWLSGRRVLISPYALLAAIGSEQRIAINLTKKQIENSPSLNTDKPVSRQFEEAYYGYYEWPGYWSGSDMWDPNFERVRNERREPTADEKVWDSHLRSTHEVRGYHLHAADGEIGHVEDFVVDDVTWKIRYLIVDTRNWWPGKKVLISPRWIQRVSWRESEVFVELTRENLKRSPEYTDESLLARDYEVELHRHYHREGYWVDEPAAKAHSNCLSS
jgi:hypothetical protein